MTGASRGPRAPRWAWAVATGLGSGRMRPAPGTWGSLAALLAWLLFTLAVVTPFTGWVQRHAADPRMKGLTLAFEGVFILAPLAMTWLAVKASDLVLAETGDKDPGYIVADEWAGMWIALWPLRWDLAYQGPRLLAPGGWTWLPVLLVPFLAFRLMDIWKPWPVRQIQDLPGALGVVADDVVAGLYAIPLVTLLAPLALSRLG